jgi:hypothetical protein
MDKPLLDKLFYINSVFNFVEPINNPIELMIGDTLYNIYVYSGYRIVVDNTATQSSTEFKDFMRFYDFILGENK